MPVRRPPYWIWTLDRWNLLVTALLLAAVLAAGLRGRPASQPALIPTFTVPAPAAQPPAAAPTGPGEPGPAEPEPRATPTPLALPAIVESGAQVTPTASVEPEVSPPLLAPAEAPAPTAPSFIGLTEGAVLLPADLRAVDGVAAPDTRVGIMEGGTAAAETVADAAGKWQVDLSGLAPGRHTLVAAALDAEGNPGAASEPVTFTVLALDLPAFLQPAIPWVVVQGTPVEIKGAATPGTTVRLFVADQPFGDAAVGPNGTWRVLLPGLSPGEHVLTVGALYGDGRLLMGAGPLVITVLPLEALPILIHPTDGGRIHSCQPLLIGYALPGRQVSIYDFQTLLGHALPEADGRWALRLDAPLALGRHTVTVVAVVDPAGHELQSRPVTFRVETPGVPCLQAGRVAPVLESPAPGSAVGSDRPLLLGTATPNSILRIYDGIQFLGEAQADADGRWVFRPDVALTPGRHRLTLVPMAAYDREGSPRMQLDLEIVAP